MNGIEFHITSLAMLRVISDRDWMTYEDTARCLKRAGIKRTEKSLAGPMRTLIKHGMIRRVGEAGRSYFSLTAKGFRYLAKWQDFFGEEK